MLYIKLIILEILLSTYKLIYKNINVRSVIIIQKYKNNHDNYRYWNSIKYKNNHDSYRYWNSIRDSEDFDAVAAAVAVAAVAVAAGAVS